MTHWHDQLRMALDQADRQSMRRSLRPVEACGRLVSHHGRTHLNFAANDYLGLATDPRLAHAAAEAAKSLGAGSGASRLITGSLEAHQHLESRFARFKHAEAALLLPTGYMANLAAITALAGPEDLLCLDKLNHASLIDAARLSGATVRTYAHRDYAKLDRLLDRAKVNGNRPRRRLIVTDAVFSMDGDCADLAQLVALRDRYEAILIVDEAHGTGVLGPTGGGLAEQVGLAERIDVSIATASKALGSLGGIVSGSQLISDTLVNTARPFIYTTAASPMQVATINAALDIVETEPDRRQRLAEVAAHLRDRLVAQGWPIQPTHGPVTPIVPLIAGSAEAAVGLSSKLESAGILAPAIRPPTVPPASSRLRLTLRYDHTDDDLNRLVEAIGECQA